MPPTLMAPTRQRRQQQGLKLLQLAGGIGPLRHAQPHSNLYQPQQLQQQKQTQWWWWVGSARRVKWMRVLSLLTASLTPPQYHPCMYSSLNRSMQPQLAVLATVVPGQLQQQHQQQQWWQCLSSLTAVLLPVMLGLQQLECALLI